MAVIRPVQIKLKNGEEITLRTATRWDGRAYSKFRHEMLITSQHLNTEPDEAVSTPAKERRTIVRTAASTNDVILLAFKNRKIIGVVETLTDRRRRLRHNTLIAISIVENYRGQGLGRMLLTYILTWIRENTAIKRAELHVHATNSSAIALYKDMGFIEEGRRRSAIHLGSEEYVDDILMCAYLDFPVEQKGEHHGP